MVYHALVDARTLIVARNREASDRFLRRPFARLDAGKIFDRPMICGTVFVAEWIDFYG